MFKSNFLFSMVLSMTLIIGKATTLEAAPLNEHLHTDPCTIVIFGGNGDLTGRKLFPALYNLSCSGILSEHTAVVGFSRGSHTHESFCNQMGDAIDQFSRIKAKGTPFWSNFKNKIFYTQSNFEQNEGYEDLKKLLENLDQELKTQGNRIYYLATSPSYFSVIIKKLHEHGLIYRSNQKKWSRVIIEKPFGKDMASALDLNETLSKHLDKDQIYLMDHYLGKEGVQNLLTLRLENALFEPVWNHQYIDHVQITLAEDIGIGTRANFWEETGTLRDVFQNHVMQLLAITAMELPNHLSLYEIHKEKIKVLNAIRQYSLNEIKNHWIRGQYEKGRINGDEVVGYKQEKGVLGNSSAETFVAAKLFIDNPRWKDVPFYIRAGKRLSRQTTEIVVTFKKPPLADSKTEANVLFIRIQPNPSVFFKVISRSPTLDKSMTPIFYGYSAVSLFKTPPSDAYEKLFYDCMTGDHSLFVEAEEQIAAWKLLAPIIDYWKSHPEKMDNYEAGTWGPSQADEMLEKHGHPWYLLEHENL